MIKTIYRYIGRQYLAWFIILLLILVGIIMLFEFIEMSRRASDRPEITMGLTLLLTALKVPQTVELVFHFTVLFSTMFAFWRLTRNQELVVARASGVSAWQFLSPVVLIAALIGVLKIMAVNPVSAAMYDRYQSLVDRHFSGQTNLLEISRGGLWLRQRDEHGLSVLFAEGTAPDEIILTGVAVFLFDHAEHYRGRIDAATAVLRDGHWEIRNAEVSLAGQPARSVAVYRLPTDFTPQTIDDSFAAPQTMSFWQLPEFIEALDDTGFSSLRHRLHYQSLLAQPLLLASMVLFGAAFSLRHSRRGGTLPMLIAGVTTGFMLFIGQDVMYALGLAETIPVIMAAWTPALLSTLIGSAMLLHFEDG